MQRPTSEDSPLCQGKLCKNFTVKTLAVKVCHHRDCQSSNNALPLLLCLDCDRATHAGISKNHARFELKGNECFEKMSSSKIAESDSGAEDDQEPVAPVYRDKVKPKNQSARRRFLKIATDNSKKKPRRHNTDDPGREFIRLKIYTEGSGDFHLELIPALKGKTLKDSLEPILEKYSISFDSHSVFLDSSNTPLPLAFETFPLSGSILHVRDNSRVTVDKRVRDISKNFESKQQPEHPVSRTPSFGKRNLKEEKEKEKEGAGKEEEKESEDTGKKGRKNTSSTPVDSDERVSQTGPVSASSGSQKGKPAGILTGLFTGNPTVIVKGKELSTVRSLPEILQYFTVHGLENESKTTALTEKEFYLEDSWTKVVDNSEDLAKTVRDQQEAIWELLSTEVAYINKLQVIKKESAKITNYVKSPQIFILCLRNIQSEGYLLELDLPSLFSNIEEIYAVNVSFWLRSLKPVVNMARHTKKLLNPFYMADGFSTFDTQFEPYLKYCMQEASCSIYFKQKPAEDELFKLYVEWCESRPECKRLKLSDLLVKPMQRLTKYPLLLKAILKKTSDEDKKKEITAMIEIVQKFVGKVDGSMKIRHEKENLNKAAVKIESYWPVDPVTDEVEKLLIDNYCDFDLSRAMPGAPRDQHRCLLYNGPLRLTEKQGKMDIHAFLFTDMILLTKAKKMDKFKVVKAPLRIDKVKVHVLKDPGTFLLVYLNEYRTVVHAYVLQASTHAVQAKWIEMIDKAKNLYQAVLQSDGSKCLTADDAGLESPVTPPNRSPSSKHKSNSWKVSTESLDVPMVRVTSSPTLRRHLSGSDGNLSLVGISENSRSSASVTRRASCNERKSKSKYDNYRRPRTESKVTRSTSDPHNKAVRAVEDVVNASDLSRSSSVPQAPKPITDKELDILTESSVDLESPPSTTSLSEVDFSETVDVDEIQMSLSPDMETPSTSPVVGTTKTVAVSTTASDQTSEGTRVSSIASRSSGADTSEKLKLLLAQKLSKTASVKKDSEKEDDSTNSRESTKRENAKRVSKNHSDRKRFPRCSSVDRAKRTGERKLALDLGSMVDSGPVKATSPSESKNVDGRKSKLTRSSSSGNRQLPDPSQISGKARHLAKENTDEGLSSKNQNSSSELNGVVTGLRMIPIDSNSGRQDLTDSTELARSVGGSIQAPPIKAPLIAGLSLSRNGSNGTDMARKRTQLPKRSPVLNRKSPSDNNMMRKSMDEQLLERKSSSPPLRRAKSEADSPVETLLTKYKNSDGKTSKSKSGPEERDKTRSRTRKTSLEHDSARRSNANDDVISGSTKSHNSSQECQVSNSHESGTNSTNLKEQETGDSVKLQGGTGEKTRRQMKKYRGRELRKLTEGDGKVASAENVGPRRENLRQAEPLLLLESSEYV